MPETPGSGYYWNQPWLFNQDPAWNYDWDDAITQMQLNAMRSNTLSDDFNVTYNPFGGGFTASRANPNMPTFGAGGGVPSSGTPSSGSPNAATPGVEQAGGGALSNAANNPWLRAGLGALASYYQADAANNSQNGSGTSWREPYMAGAINPDLLAILDAQRQQFSQGYQPYNPNGRAGGGGGGGGGGGMTMMDYSSAGPSVPDMLRDVYGRATGASNSLDRNNWRDATGAIISGGGGGGFGNYNAAAADLYGRLGNASFDLGTNSIMNFLGGGGGGGGFGGGGRGYGGGSSGGMVPDATGNGLFGTEVRKIFDEQANQALLGELIGYFRDDAVGAHQASLADINASLAGAGRLGSSYYGAQRDAANATFERNFGQQAAGLRYQDLNDRRNARLGALGLVNSRDIAAMQDATANNSINSSAGSAARGQDLQALGLLLNHQQFGLSQLGDLARLRSGDYQSGLGHLSGLSGAYQQDLGQALGAGQALGQYEVGMGNIRNASAANNLARQRFNFDVHQSNQGLGQQAINDYLRTVMGIGGMGGIGQNTQIGGGGSDPTTAAIIGALGGWLSTRGT